MKPYKSKVIGEIGDEAVSCKELVNAIIMGAAIPWKVVSAVEQMTGYRVYGFAVLQGEGERFVSPIFKKELSDFYNHISEFIGANPKMKFIKNQFVENSGGGCMLDILTLDDEKVVVISDEGVGVYHTLKDMYECRGGEALQYIAFEDVKPPLPDWPVDHPIWVRTAADSEWRPRHFSNFNKDGLCETFFNGGTHHSTVTTTGFKFYTDVNPFASTGAD